MVVIMTKNESGDISIHRLTEDELKYWAYQTNSEVEVFQDNVKLVKFKIGNVAIKLFN